MSDDMVKVGDTDEYRELQAAERRREAEELAEYFRPLPEPEPSLFEKVFARLRPERLWLAKKRVVWFFREKLGRIRKITSKEE